VINSNPENSPNPISECPAIRSRLMSKSVMCRARICGEVSRTRDFMIESADESSGLLSGGRNWLSCSVTRANWDRLTKSDITKLDAVIQVDEGVS